MPLEAVRKIEALEQEIQKAMQDAKKAAAEQIADAEREGKMILQKRKEEGGKQSAILMEQAEREAEGERQKIFDQAEKQCNELRRQAVLKETEAVQEIVKRVSKWQS